jgi:hypothetical protein
MRVPDYGRGNWDIKYARNCNLPSIKDIGLRKDTIYVALSQKADSIKVTGQDHTTLALAKDADFLSYVMTSKDPYARFTAYFSEGEVIWSNPFARYDASVAESPIDKESSHSINLVFTILFNIMLAAIAAGAVTCIYKLWKRK